MFTFLDWSIFSQVNPMVSLPGLTGQSSIPGRWLLDRPVKPGDDSTEVNLIEKCTWRPRRTIRNALPQCDFVDPT
jgi:hypothetical protein